MQTYIIQLIEDLTEVSKTRLEAPYKSFDTDKVATDNSYFHIFGIPNEAFPPMEMLNENQAKQLVEAMVNLLKVNEVSLNFPERLPPYKILYRELRREWHEGIFLILPTDSYTMVGIDFCHCNGETCPWGMEYCACKDREHYIATEEVQEKIEEKTKQKAKTKIKRKFEEDDDSDIPF